MRKRIEGSRAEQIIGTAQMGLYSICGPADNYDAMKLRCIASGKIVQAELWSYGVDPILIVAGAILLMPGADVLQRYELVEATAPEEAATSWAGFKFAQKAAQPCVTQ